MGEYLVITIIIVAIIAFIVNKKRQNPKSHQPTKNMTIDDQFNSDRREREKEIDHLLDKMGKNGIEDLSAKDRKRLDELSKKIR